MPDSRHFGTTGCSLHSDCLTCPFVVCRHDIPGGGGTRTLLNLKRDKEIRELHRGGAKAAVIARRFEVSIRTVHRALA